MNKTHIDRIMQIQQLNIKLSNVLIEITSKLIRYSKTHEIELPYEIKPLLEQAHNYMYELKYPIAISKECSICKNLNPENADYCCYCGSSLVITRVRQKDDVTRNSDRTMIVNI